jgi:predicted small lipoprotein YifL
MKRILTVIMLLLILVVALAGCALGSPTSNPSRDNTLNGDSRYTIEKVNNQIIFIHLTKSFSGATWNNIIEKQMDTINSAIISLSKEYEIKQIIRYETQDGTIESPILVIIGAEINGQEK